MEVLPREADAAEAVVATAAVDTPHEISAPRASLASLAVRTADAAGETRRVRAVGAITGARAVVGASDVRAVLEERRVRAALAARAREAADVGGGRPVGTRELFEPLFELARRHRRRAFLRALRDREKRNVVCLSKVADCTTLPSIVAAQAPIPGGRSRAPGPEEDSHEARRFVPRCSRSLWSPWSRRPSCAPCRARQVP